MSYTEIGLHFSKSIKVKCEKDSISQKKNVSR